MYYGDALYVYPNGRERLQFKRFTGELEKKIEGKVKTATMPCHQAIFARKSCFINNQFDLNYKLRAELKWFINCYMNYMKMKELGFLVSKYVLGGTSDKPDNLALSNVETTRLLHESGLLQERNAEVFYETKDNRTAAMFMMLDKWLALKQAGKSFENYFAPKGYSKIAVYGYSLLGNHLLIELEDTSIQVQYIIDRDKKYPCSGIPVYSMEDSLQKVDAIVVTVALHFDEIETTLKKKVQCPIIALDDVLEEVWFM